MSYLLRGDQSDQPKEGFLWNLDENSSAEEKREFAFELIRTTAFLPTATLNEDGPANRVIEYTRLHDGRLVFMTSSHKRFCDQLRKNPKVSICATVDQWTGLRLDACVEEVTQDEATYKEYYALNPGVEKMFRHDYSITSIWQLTKGHGDIYYLYDSDHIRRIRFSFGEEEETPFRFQITDSCIGCGCCSKVCAEDTIERMENGKYRILTTGCEECGICYNTCPLKDRALVKLK